MKLALEHDALRTSSSHEECPLKKVKQRTHEAPELNEEAGMEGYVIFMVGFKIAYNLNKW